MGLGRECVSPLPSISEKHFKEARRRVTKTKTSGAKLRWDFVLKNSSTKAVAPPGQQVRRSEQDAPWRMARPWGVKGGGESEERELSLEPRWFVGLDRGCGGCELVPDERVENGMNKC